MQIIRNIKRNYIIVVLACKMGVRSVLVKGLKVCFLISLLTGCSDFLEVDLPRNQLTSETVFNNDAMAESTLKGIYAKMRDGGLLASGSNISMNLGLYTDELNPAGPSDFFSHNIISANSTISNWWDHAYEIIYAANSVIEGVENSTVLSTEDQEQFKGEALFVRAYIHSLLVELFGPVPYISTTDYPSNARVTRMPVDSVYTQIISDLTEAYDLLGNDMSGKIRPYKEVVGALLARVYLYKEEWSLAESMADKLINSFVLEQDLNKVFLKNSSGSIWQFKPQLEGENTSDGFNFIFTITPGTRPTLSASLVEDAFEPNDLRKSIWVKKVSGNTEEWYHAYKYRESGNTFVLNNQNEEVPTSFEYPIIFRLAEQYLIRAEARARQGNISGAQEDLNVIRNRAGLSNTNAATRDELLIAILQERRVEFFTEQGHRWFDIKRMEKASEILAPIKPNWRDTNVLFPVPESEILLNPNLLPQNPGYN